MCTFGQDNLSRLGKAWAIVALALWLVVAAAFVDVGVFGSPWTGWPAVAGAATWGGLVSTVAALKERYL